MNHPSIPQRIISQSVSAVQTPSTLREGQMFHGQIKQLFPGQMAEVQIGNQKLMAKLEVPMKAGDAYYFQVKSVEPELQLKVISGPVQASEGQTKQLMNLMETLKLPNTQEIQDLLKHFMKNKIPVTREILLSAEKLLKAVPSTMRNEALNAIQKVVELKLPLNEMNFKSLLAVETKEGMHNVLSSLKMAIAEDSGIDPKIRAGILNSLDSLGKLTTTATEKALLTGTLLKLLDDSVPKEERFQLLQIMKQEGVLPKHTSLANLQTVMHSSIVSLGQTGGEIISQQQVQVQQQTPGQQQIQANQQAAETTIGTQQIPRSELQLAGAKLVDTWQSILKVVAQGRPTEVAQLMNQLKTVIQNDPVIQQVVKHQLIALLSQIEKMPLSEMKTSAMTEQLSQSLVKIVAEQSQAYPFRSGVTMDIPKLLEVDTASKLAGLYRAVENSALPIMKELIAESQTAVGQAIDGRVMKDAMQSVLKSLGINYEAEMLNRDADFVKTAEQLKPQLLSLLQDSSISSPTRAATEAVITRMNGPILQSTETGMNQQIIMQVPLELLGKRIDATLQWNGRLKDDGKIDPDFARIMFYLDLESIKKTVIDMQVQNRVVTVTVFNDDEHLKIIGNTLQEKLKDGLESADYRLSGISFKKFEEEKKVSNKQQEVKQDKQGVDFRI